MTPEIYAQRALVIQGITNLPKRSKRRMLMEDRLVRSTAILLALEPSVKMKSRDEVVADILMRRNARWNHIF